MYLESVTARLNGRCKILIEQRVLDIKERVGDSKVLLGLSGGVDSSVTAMLLDKAIGKNLICMFVDNGLLRKNEAEEVEAFI